MTCTRLENEVVAGVADGLTEALVVADPDIVDEAVFEWVGL